MERALDGIRVLDFTRHLAGPGTCMYLADQGADVIKVEPIGLGDPSRKGNSATFLVLNRNKRSMTLDLRKAKGKEVLHRLVERSDVLIHNVRRRTAEKLGIGYDDLRKVNAGLVYGCISAYGSKGPYADKGGYDGMTQSLSGAMSRRAPDGTPVTAGVWISDCSVPMLMAYGITLALRVRDKTGLGQQVETSLLQAAVAMQSNYLVRFDEHPTPPPEPGSPGYGTYRCGDDVFITVGALQQDQFQRLCMVLDLPHLAHDPRFSHPRGQHELRAEVYPIVAELLRTKPSSQWLELLDGADIPCAPIRDRSEAIDEPQIVENEFIVPVDHPEAGRVRMMGVPVRLSMTPGAIRNPAPLVGEHTDEVLREFGYGPEEIQALRAEAVV